MHGQPKLQNTKIVYVESAKLSKAIDDVIDMKLDQHNQAKLQIGVAINFTLSNQTCHIYDILCKTIVRVLELGQEPGQECCHIERVQTSIHAHRGSTSVECAEDLARLQSQLNCPSVGKVSGHLGKDFCWISVKVPDAFW